MIRVLILVEGSTEEAFANRVLRPHLSAFGVFLERPSILRTKELPAGSPYKGGVTTFGRIERDVRRLLSDSSAMVTTLLDYYGLPQDFPGMNNLQNVRGSHARATVLEAEFAKSIEHRRFIPFLALHEFEALIFANAAAVAAEEHLSINGLARRLSVEAQHCGGPEEVNNDPVTCPSRRLAQAVETLGRRRYSKVGDGPEILAKAGIQSIRAECPHFSQWLARIENLRRFDSK